MRGAPSAEPLASRAARVALAGLAVASVAFVCSCEGSHAPQGDATLSLLAVGDTGARPDAEEHAVQLAVAAEMEREAAERPVDALLFLGDHFYDHGLTPETVASRVAANLVQPYCRFLDLRAPRGAEVSAACAIPEAERTPVPLLAVLGNHDYDLPESARLQREEVPRLVANWQLPAGPAATVELRGGVSLVRFDSTRTYAGANAADADTNALREALRRTRGPWRILALHHPLAGGERPPVRDQQRRYRAHVEAAITDAGVPVHLVLAGHEHNLQVLTPKPPSPPLHVTAGGGSSGRRIRDLSRERTVRFESPGFARVDLVGADAVAGSSGEPPRLVVSLIRVDPGPFDTEGAERVAVWSVDLDGRVAQE